MPPSPFDSRFPVLLPNTPALFLSSEDFDGYVAIALEYGLTAAMNHVVSEDSFLSVDGEAASYAQGSTAQVQGSTAHDAQNESQRSDISEAQRNTTLSRDSDDPSMADRQQDHEPSPTSDPEYMMRTDKQDLAVRNTRSALVDLYFELDESISGNQLRERLDDAWLEDPLSTLKIIFNARSIHLGKGSKMVFYKACGWLAQYHPRTLIVNLHWLARPIIPLKKGKTVTETDSQGNNIDENPVIIKRKSDMRPDDVSRFDVKDGGAHGYYKDLLNLLALAANAQLSVESQPRTVLNFKEERKPASEWTPGKERRLAQNIKRNTKVVKMLLTNPLYHCLHLSIARCFADQLKVDMALLKSGKKCDRKKISLAAKWAPTSKLFHDKHTYIASTIAELLFSHRDVCPNVPLENRELYLKHARGAYQKLTLSPLRKALGILECALSTNNFSTINYDRVPALAMAQYTKLFALKDEDRFVQFLDDVIIGKEKISGAVLLPSVLVHSVRNPPVSARGQNADAPEDMKAKNVKLGEIEAKSTDAQWYTLVNRMKASGKLSFSVAVCDVSNSMEGPRFPDGTCPMDAAIGLSLLVAEVTAAPWRGLLISFSGEPKVQQPCHPNGDKRTLRENIARMEQSIWGGNTDLVAVFERCILKYAVDNNVTPASMVKQVFVFSDMHFDAEAGPGGNWISSFDRITAKFAQAGYLMPKLVFWNLAGGRDGGDAPKPVHSDEAGTALVSGYSQGQLKMFLEGGWLEDPEDAMEIDEPEGSVVGASFVLKKALSHRAYSMLKVVD